MGTSNSDNNECGGGKDHPHAYGDKGIRQDVTA